MPPRWLEPLYKLAHWLQWGGWPIVTSIYDVTIVRPRPDENRMFCSGVRIVARASRQAPDDTATSSLTLGVVQRDNLRRQERLDDRRSSEKRISEARRRGERDQPTRCFRNPSCYRLLTQIRLSQSCGQAPCGHDYEANFGAIGSSRSKAKNKFGHGGTHVFAIFGKHEILSPKPSRYQRTASVFFFVLAAWKVEPVFSEIKNKRFFDWAVPPSLVINTTLLKD